MVDAATIDRLLGPEGRGATYCDGPDVWEPGSGTCATCGSEIAINERTGRRPDWFCSWRCAEDWRNEHWWNRAKKRALKRAHGRCQRCHGLQKHVGKLQVDHIMPRAAGQSPVGRRENGRRLGATSCANHSSNLRAICRPCHREVTSEQRAAGLLERSGAR